MSTSPIFDFAKNGDANGLLYHLQKDIDSLNKRDAYGSTALIYAAWAGNVPMVCMLVGAGADVNCQNRWGISALHLAAESGRLDVVRVLIEAGADPTLRNEESYIPVEVATSPVIIDYLINL